MLKELLLPEIEDLIEQNQWKDISEILSLWQEAETADLITSIKKNEDKINIFK
ncbi:magnesium transporter, partial [Brachyspira pilosicoli]|nr:magnesium transporter [Brachyspira pilosicoli]